MPTNNNQEIRRKILDYYISEYQEKPLNKIDLLEKVNDKLESDDFIAISERTLSSDIRHLRSMVDREGVNLEVKGGRGGYYYSEKGYSLYKSSVSQNDLDVLTQVLAMMESFSQFNNVEFLKSIISKLSHRLGLQDKKLGNIISLDTVKNLKGVEHLNDLLHHIINKNVIQMEYTPFYKDTVSHVVHPYFLKEFNNRWYLFGLYDEKQKIYSYPIDRINGFFPKHNVEFNDKENTTPQEWLKDVIGVTRYEDGKVQKIKLKFSGLRRHYITTKPLHPSQQILSEYENEIIVSIKVIPNRELISMINYFGNDVEWINKEKVELHPGMLEDPKPQ